MKIWNPISGDSYTLFSVHLVGRAERCDLRITNKRVSSQHAEFRWTGSSWELRDLNSRNGTYIDGHRIDSQRLERGMRIAFGDPDDELEVIDTAAPVPRATRDDGVVVAATGRLLCLPGPDDPVISVLEQGDGQWLMEPRDRDRSPVTDGHVLRIGAHTWTLHLPVITETTWQADGEHLALRRLTLRFEVGGDGTNIDIELRQGVTPLRWPGRAHHKMLLYLAEQRIEDQGDPQISEAEEGWVYTSDLLNDLDISSNTLYQYIYRTRDKLDQAEVFGAPDIIERRCGSGQVRIGVSRLEIVYL